MELPDNRGHFGNFGGQFVPETLMPALEELTLAYDDAKNETVFQEELQYYLRDYVGRPTPFILRKG